MRSPNALTHGTDSSRRFHASTNRPPGRSTRWTSDRARIASNQWNACAATTASTEPAGRGMASAVPSTISTPGAPPSAAASFVRMPGTGSRATIRAPVGTSSVVSLPVPAPSSSTVRPGRRSSRSTIAPTASSGYPGLARSYRSAVEAYPRAAAGWTVSVMGRSYGSAA